MNRRIAFVGAALLASILGAAAIARQSQAPRREATFAAKYVIYELARIVSPSQRAARERCGSACGSDVGDIEMAIGLLGIGGQPTTESLLNLLSVKLDAGGAEERSCQIAKRGKRLVPSLRQFSSARAARWCRETFSELRKRELSDIKDISTDQLCHPSAEIEVERKGWITSLQSGRNLFAESGPC